MIRSLYRSICFFAAKIPESFCKSGTRVVSLEESPGENLHIHACCCICLQCCDVLFRWKSKVFRWCLCCRERERKILNRDDLLRMDKSDARRHVAGVRNLIIAKFQAACIITSMHWLISFSSELYAHSTSAKRNHKIHTSHRTTKQLSTSSKCACFPISSQHLLIFFSLSSPAKLTFFTN